MSIVIKQSIDTRLSRIPTLLLLILWRAIVVIHQHQSESIVPSTFMSYAVVGELTLSFPFAISVDLVAPSRPYIPHHIREVYLMQSPLCRRYVSRRGLTISLSMVGWLTSLKPVTNQTTLVFLGINSIRAVTLDKQFPDRPYTLPDPFDDFRTLNPPDLFFPDPKARSRILALFLPCIPQCICD